MHPYLPFGPLPSSHLSVLYNGGASEMRERLVQVQTPGTVSPPNGHKKPSVTQSVGAGKEVAMVRREQDA